MKRILIRVLAAIGAVTVCFILLGILSMSLMMRRFSGDGIPAKTILELNLERGLVEYVPEDPMTGIFSRRVPTVRDVVEALEGAAGDERVVAVLARVGSRGLGLAQIQEVRDAVLAFRQSKKPAIAYAETLARRDRGPAHTILPPLLRVFTCNLPAMSAFRD